MDKSSTSANNFFNGNALVELGYRDYIAARVLLNNHLIVQGLTLASTAVEKYFKSLIVFNLKEKGRYNYHFDNVEKLQSLLAKINRNEVERFDPVFKEILENAFKIRYYDNIREPIFMGFYLNQFIGELDETIDNLEKLIAQTEIGEKWNTPYKRAINKVDPHLYENNFILSNQSKKDFMEKPATAFSIYIRVSDGFQEEKIVKGEDIIIKYEGRMAVFKEFQDNFLL